MCANEWHTRNDKCHLSQKTYLHDQLMCPSNEIKPILSIKLFRNVLTKGVASSAGGNPPARPVVGIGPEQIAHWALVGNLLDSIDSPNIVQRVQPGR